MDSALANVPAHLTIKVLYSDDDIIVIDKPCNLRSVPGHASEQNKNDDDVEKTNEKSVDDKPQRLTAQEAWVKAIHSFASQNGKAVNDSHTSQIVSGDDYQNKAINELIYNLSITSDTNSIPRKCPLFERYCQRNRRRLLPSFPELDSFSSEDDKSSQEPPAKRAKKSYNIPMKLRNIAQIVFLMVQQRQRPLMNLPTPTEDEESAIGQIRLLGFGDYAHNNHGQPEKLEDVKKRIADESRENGEKKFKLHVVHRLDMQTSGIMVVARNADSASVLCELWRERKSISKTYLAFVKHWPPYHEQNTHTGKIDLPLAASRTERIKWEVRPIEDGGKASLTIWKVYQSDSDAAKTELESNNESKNEGLTLELQPMTGRTHQLRIHCAEIGSGIEGDSLYGDNPVEWIEGKHQNIDQSGESTCKTLRLHAHKLSFPHPTSGKELSFESPKPW